MGKGYDLIKATVKTATDKQLKEMYNSLNLNEESDTADALVWTALTNEMEERNLIRFNEETWEYEFI